VSSEYLSTQVLNSRNFDIPSTNTEIVLQFTLFGNLNSTLVSITVQKQRL
jgi:hypothetical protein